MGSTALRLNSDTAFQFLNLDHQTIQIQLSQGTLVVRARNPAQNQNLDLDTPGLAFTVLRARAYRIGADLDEQTTAVTVRDGDGEVSGGGHTLPVHGGQQAIVVGGDQITYSLVSAPRATVTAAISEASSSGNTTASIPSGRGQGQARQE